MLFGVWMLYGGFGLLVASLAPVSGIIVNDLNISHAAMGTIMGAWQFVYIFSALPSGLLLDRLGARYALLIGGVLIAASAFARGMAEDFTQLLLAVMLFGLGGPIISAGAPKVITSLFTGQDRGLAMGIYMTGPALGGILSLTLTHSLLLPLLGSWRSVMLLWGVVVLLATAAWFLINLKPTPSLTAESSAAAKSPQGRLLLTLIKQPAVLVVLFMSVGVFLFNHGLNNWLPELLRSTGMTVVAAGYWAALPTLIGLVGSLLIPRLATPERRFHILLGLSISAGLASLLLLFSGNEVTLFVGLFLQGLVRASLMTVLILTLVELPGIGDRYAGVASGLFFTFAEVGGVLGPLSLGLFYDVTGGFSAGLYFLSAVSVLLVISSVVLKSLARK